LYKLAVVGLLHQV